jgi:hypothetical protein
VADAELFAQVAAAAALGDLAQAAGHIGLIAAHPARGGPKALIHNPGVRRGAPCVSHSTSELEEVSVPQPAGVT